MQFRGLGFLTLGLKGTTTTTTTTAAAAAAAATTTTLALGTSGSSRADRAGWILAVRVDFSEPDSVEVHSV